jgi:hypothetical protein
MKTSLRTQLGLAAFALSLLAVASVVVSASSSSTNFTLDTESAPYGADMTFSTNFRMAGVLPESPAGAITVSTNYQIETVIVPDSYGPDDTTAPVITAGPAAVYIADTIVVIEWETDEQADGSVDYGLTTAYGSSDSHTGYSAFHQVVLTGLTANTLYNFQVSSTDPYLNGPTTSTNATFTTAAAADTTGPTLMATTVTFLSISSAQIDFTTNEPAESDLEWGPTAALGTSLADPAFLTTHTRTISGLLANTQYFYDITVTDPSGNATNQGVLSFTTPSAVSITTLTLPNGKAGDAYTDAITAINGVGAYTFSLNSGTLPPGLVLDTTGTLSGTPTSSGTFNFDVLVTDSGAPTSTDNAAYTVVISKKSSGGGDDDDGGCSTSGSSGWWLVILLAMTGLAVARPRARGAR